jgi:hypothetical protein
MSGRHQRLSPLQQQQHTQLLGLLGQCSDHLGTSDDTDSLVEGARVWLIELKQEEVQLQAVAKPTLKEKLRLTEVQYYVELCDSIASIDEGLKQSSSLCKLVIPADAALYRKNNTREDQLPKDIVIKNARFVNGPGVTGMRFLVPTKTHVVQSESFECSALHLSCELAEAGGSHAHASAIVTVVSVTKSLHQADPAAAGSDVEAFDVVVSAVPQVRLLPPPEAFCAGLYNGKPVEMMSKKNFQSWQRMEMIKVGDQFSAAEGGWSQDEFAKWLKAAQDERCALANYHHICFYAVECAAASRIPSAPSCHNVVL